MKYYIHGLLYLLIIPSGIFAQGLFQDAATQAEENTLPFQLSGYGRGSIYLGEYFESPSPEIKSTYAEAALKIDAVSGSRAHFFSELRFRTGYEYNQWLNDFSVREAFADIDLGNFEIRAGYSIMAWGRADVFNPSNNLTPQNYFVRSPEPDDKRMGNFLVRGRYHILPTLRLEAIWIPKYKYSVFRFDLFEMPDFIKFTNSDLPEATLEKGSVAAKLDFLFERFDGSLSWFNGFDPLPGIQAGDIPGNPDEELVIDMYASAFRQQTLGLDFSFGLGFIGVRGEAAFRAPTPEYKDKVFAPCSDLRYVLEMDRSFGIFNLMVTYIGHYVFEFTDLPLQGGMQEIDPQKLQDSSVFAMLGPMLDQQVLIFNRIIFDQTREMTFTLGIQPAINLFHGISRLELFGLYNVTTEEWCLIPNWTWKATDNVKISIGGQYFSGPANSMNELIAPVFNGGFFEMRYSF